MSKFDVEQVRKLKEAIDMAHWHLDLWRFSEIIGSDFQSCVYAGEVPRPVRT